MSSFARHLLTMTRRILIITAVERESEAIGDLGDRVVIVAGGVGRTNAACCTTQAIIDLGRFDMVMSAGVAGSLPGSEISIGDTVLASHSVYMEEGIETESGFADLASMGFPLGGFNGNAVPGDPGLLRHLGESFPMGRVATVATCSGTDARAAAVAERTGAVAEAMEGAAVLHAAQRLHVPAVELRAISNTTGDRQQQIWDLETGLRRLGEAVAIAVKQIRDAG